MADAYWLCKFVRTNFGQNGQCRVLQELQGITIEMHLFANFQ